MRVMDSASTGVAWRTRKNDIDRFIVPTTTAAPRRPCHNPSRKRGSTVLKGTSREAVAEFFGTFILITFGVGAVAQNVLSRSANGSYFAINIGWGLAVMLGAYASFGVSGAHLN